MDGPAAAASFCNANLRFHFQIGLTRGASFAFIRWSLLCTQPLVISPSAQKHSGTTGRLRMDVEINRVTWVSVRATSSQLKSLIPPKPVTRLKTQDSLVVDSQELCESVFLGVVL